MSTTMGFRFLYEADYIVREMDAWFHVGLPQSPLLSLTLFQERNLHYVVHIEVFLGKVFGSIPTDIEDEQLCGACL